MARHSESRLRFQRGGKRFHGLALGLWLAVLAVGAGTLHGEVQFDVFLGYDGIVPQACWFPAVCELKNNGPGFVGTVEIDGGSFNPGQVRRAVVELPPGTMKRFVIPLFSGSDTFGGWDARLLDERGRVREERSGLPIKRRLSANSPLLGSMARTPSGTPVIRPILPKEAMLQPAVAQLLPAIFPDNAVALQGMNCLYLNSEKAPELKENQIQALLAWLHGGGHLILGVEQVSDITATPWLRRELPCELNDIQSVQDHSDLQTWLRGTASPARVSSPVNPPVTGRPPRRTPRTTVSTSNPFGDLLVDSAFERAAMHVATGEVRDGRVVVSAGDKPLMVTAGRGSGRVTVLLFSPEREPFRSWKNQPLFWARLAEVPQAWYESENHNQPWGWSTDGIFGAMIDTRQVHKLPVTWLLLLLLVYLLVIGPLDRRWLKRIGRPMLTWITFPCYVVLFSLLIYFIGYKLRAGESEWNELHLVDVLPKGEKAELRGQTYASVYSPANERYLLANPGRQDYAALRGEFSGMGGAGHSSARANFLQAGDGAFQADVFVPVWTSRLLVSDWWQAAEVPLKLTVIPQDGGWQVQVENRTERSLANAQLVIDDRMTPLGEVPARQSRTFQVTKGQGTPLRAFVSQHAAAFQNAVQSRQSTFGGRGSGRIDDLPNATMAASFLGAAGRGQEGMQQFITSRGLDISPVAAHGNAVLLAWAADYAPVPPLRQFAPRRSQRNTLWRVAVPVQTPKSNS